MSQNYVIFVENRRIKIAFDKKIKGNDVLVKSDSNKELISGSDSKKIKILVRKLERGELQQVAFKTNKVKRLFAQIAKSYDKYIVAAGGIIFNSKQQILVIFRNGKWDLPKGKLELGEKLIDAAAREVKEETGIKKLTVLTKYKYTYHTFISQGGNHILKETVWYLMYSDDDKFKPQTKEGIAKVEWLDAKRIDEVLDNTYGNIQLLLKRFNL